MELSPVSFPMFGAFLKVFNEAFIGRYLYDVSVLFLSAKERAGESFTRRPEGHHGYKFLRFRHVLCHRLTHRRSIFKDCQRADVKGATCTVTGH